MSIGSEDTHSVIESYEKAAYLLDLEQYNDSTYCEDFFLPSSTMNTPDTFNLQFFDHILPHAIFAGVLDAFYNSQRDELTLKFISK